ERPGSPRRMGAGLTSNNTFRSSVVRRSRSRAPVRTLAMPSDSTSDGYRKAQPPGDVRACWPTCVLGSLTRSEDIRPTIAWDCGPTAPGQPSRRAFLARHSPAVGVWATGVTHHGALCCLNEHGVIDRASRVVDPAAAFPIVVC